MFAMRVSVKDKYAILAGAFFCRIGADYKA